MPMNFESDKPGGIDEDIKQIKSFFDKFEKLDTSALNWFFIPNFLFGIFLLNWKNGLTNIFYAFMQFEWKNI